MASISLLICGVVSYIQNRWFSRRNFQPSTVSMCHFHRGKMKHFIDWIWKGNLFFWPPTCFLTPHPVFLTPPASWDLLGDTHLLCGAYCDVKDTIETCKHCCRKQSPSMWSMWCAGNTLHVAPCRKAPCLAFLRAGREGENICHTSSLTLPWHKLSTTRVWSRHSC